MQLKLWPAQKIWNALEHVEGQDKIELSLYIYCSRPKIEFV